METGKYRAGETDRKIHRRENGDRKIHRRENIGKYRDGEIWRQGYTQTGKHRDRATQRRVNIKTG